MLSEFLHILFMLNPKSVSMAQKLANLYVKVKKPVQAKEIMKKSLCREM